MSDLINANRRNFLQIASTGAAALTAAGFGLLQPARAQSASASRAIASPNNAATLAPIRQIKAGVLDIGYYEAGPANGPVVLLLHGWPYDIHSFIEVAPLLTAKGYRVIVPHPILVWRRASELHIHNQAEKRSLGKDTWDVPKLWVTLITCRVSIFDGAISSNCRPLAFLTKIASA
ncbi:haloalkane dehalogenase [Afipia felis]|uniref:Haloalkane dehalogenase n=1 Tax=Afipia felis TaxID=1035 RepID=A0A090MUU6_AFIFE|nr:hypothetical protein [Afipia felis]CEG10162.1 haloalkane dehalogenase [Afipia felis]